MSSNEFSLPDELGWQCNDELNQLIDEVFTNAMSFMQDKRITMQGSYDLYWSAVKAELIDEMYAIIKRHQLKDDTLTPNNKETT